MSKNKTTNPDDDAVKQKAEEASTTAKEENPEGQKGDQTETAEGTAQQEEATKEKEELSEFEVLKEELAREKDKFTRLFAEFENYKRRTSKERVELFKTAGEEVMQAMLPVLDDFDRAINEIKKSADKGLLEGVQLINSKLRDTLHNKGLEQMTVKEGDKFDSDLHEAVSQIPAPKKKLKGKIVDVVEKGYTLGDKIIRFPKVVTGK